MKNYLIEVTDVLVKRFIIYADSEKEAEAYAHNGEYVLDNEHDFSDRVTECLGEALPGDIEMYGGGN